MSGYLERLIGRVVHGRTDTRPAIGPRYSPSHPEAPPQDAATAPGETARSDPPSSPRSQRGQAFAASSGFSERPIEPVASSRPRLGGRAKRREQASAAPADRQPATHPAEAAAPPKPAPRDASEGQAHAQPPAATPGDDLGQTPAPAAASQAFAAANGRLSEETPFLLPPVDAARADGPAAPAAAREPGSASARPQRGEAETPSVTVRIGRIEVRQEKSDSTERKVQARPAYRPRLCLDDYLAERREGKR